MTWKDLKEKIEEAGVKDDSEIRYIDFTDWGCLDKDSIDVYYNSEANTFAVT